MNDPYDALTERVSDLEKRATELERRVESQAASMWGNEREGREGFLQDLRELKAEIKAAREVADATAQERRDELSERRGLQRAVNWTGVTNLATLAGLAYVLYNLYQLVGS